MAAESHHGNGAGGFLILMAVLFAVVAWLVAHNPLVKFASYFWELLALPFSWFPFGTEEEIKWLKLARNPIYVDGVKFSHLLSVGAAVGVYWWSVLGLVIGFAVWDLLSSVTLRARQKHTIDSFLAVHAKRWAAIVPWLKRDLTNNSKGPMVRSLSAFEYAQRHKLLLPANRNGGKGRFDLDIPAARQRLIEDVGPESVALSGLKSFRPYEQAMFTVFAWRILRVKAGKVLKSQMLLNTLNRSAMSSVNGRVDPGVIHAHFVEVMEVLRTKKGAKEKNIWRLRSVIAAHRWRRTLLVGMLVEARKYDGTLQPAEFLWLKEHDRTLWYALQRAPVGGKLSFTSFSEGAAVLACWQAETVVHLNQRWLKTPWVEGSLRALQEDLYVCGYIDTQPVGV